MNKVIPSLLIMFLLPQSLSVEASGVGDKVEKVFRYFTNSELSDEQYMIRYLEKGDRKSAYPYIVKLANSGNPIGEYQLGLTYEYGGIVEKNISEAKKWFEKSANRNNLNASYKLGKILMKEGAYNKAVNYLTPVANSNHAERLEAIRLLGDIEMNAHKNTKKAIYYYEQAALGKNYFAELRLADYHYKMKNYEKAFEYYRRYTTGYNKTPKERNKFDLTFDKKDAHAYSNLGYMYEKGIGTFINYSEAYNNYMKASGRGSAFAHFKLAEFLENGVSIRQDMGRAFEYYGKACDAGYQRGCDRYKYINQLPSNNAPIIYNEIIINN